jgi:4-hydroxyphenylacetate 3-monooxygenase
MRTGSDYKASLKDERAVYLHGERVADVTEHAAFRPIVEAMADLFDFADSHREVMAQQSSQTGREFNRIYSIPRSQEELSARRRAVEAWASRTHGWVGRSPDHVASFLAGFAAHPETFTTDERDFGKNVVDYYEHVRDNDLYVSYAIIPPQVSRATTAHDWEGDFIQVGVVDETEEGIIVRGAQMLATGAAVADELLVSCIKPLTPDDQDFALTFAVPIATEGLRLYCREAYASPAVDEYDYPLSSRYDESDALVVFDDVLVPWDRVFVYRDVDRLKRQFFETGAHVLGNWQAQTRFCVKLRFIAGIARKATAINGVDRFPGVQEKLGELASLVAMVEAAVIAAEYGAAPDGAGVWLPAARPLYGVMGFQSELYPRVLSILRELVGGGVLQLPSSVADMRSPELRKDIDRYIQSPNVPAEERIKLFKLAWDVVGSEFAGRHAQYEMFYAGAPFVAKGYAYRNFGYDDCVADVDGFLATYGVDR